MKEERHIREYFKPAGLRQKNRQTLVENLKPQKILTNSLDGVDALVGTNTIVVNNVEETNHMDTANVKAQHIFSTGDETDKKECRSNNSLDFNMTSNYRKNSLIRAKILVSKALKDTKEDLKVEEKVAPAPILRDRILARKRLFNYDENDTTDTLSDALNDAAPKYEQLREKLPTVPAFKRFKHLIETPSPKTSKEPEYPYETDFPLPPSYQKLLHFYRATDSLLYIMYQRKEGCNFLRLKKMVEASTKRTFWRSDLAKIVGLRPNDFKLYLNERPDGITNEMHNKVDKRDSLLMITPDYTEALEKFNFSESPSKYERDKVALDRLPSITPLNLYKHASPSKTPQLYSPMCVSPIKSSAVYQTPPKTDNCLSPMKAQRNVVRPSHLRWRKDQLHSILLCKTHDQHKTFLKQIGMDTLKYSEVKRWHPKFNLNDVESIKEIDLPDGFKFKTTNSAKDLLVDTEIKLNSVIRKAVEDVVKREHGLAELSPAKEQDNNDMSSGVYCLTPVCQKVLGSIPNSLLQKIREKEKKNAQIKMMIKQDADDEKDKLQKLPELLKLMFNYLRSEKKTCMLLPKVVDKMMQSFTHTLSRELMEEHIVLLSQVVPDLVTIPKIGNHRFVKIVQIRCTLNDALGIIQDKISKT